MGALCLVDAVDNTVYAPLGPGFPSALAALRATSSGVLQRQSIDSSESGSPSAQGGDNMGTTTEARDRSGSSSSSKNDTNNEEQDQGPGEGWEGGKGRGVLGDGSWRQQRMSTGGLPVAIIGSGLGGGCAPEEANYAQFFEVRAESKANRKSGR